MEILNKKNQKINNINEWQNAVPQKDWVKGRSTYSLAQFILEMNGLEHIKHIINELLNDNNIVFEKGIIEHEVKFDNKGKGRCHDLGIWGKTKNSNKTFFIGIESKVDEPFGPTLSEAYISGITKKINKENTNLPERIETLIKQNFGDKINYKHFELRYQLLYATIGTLNEKADISIFFTIVFKNNSYDKNKGSENYRDYCQFIKNVIVKRIPSTIYNVEICQLIIDKQEMYSVYNEVDFDCNELTV